MCDSLRIKLLKFYNGSQWSSYLLHCKSLFLGAINHCFGNKSQTDPSPCIVMPVNGNRDTMAPLLQGGGASSCHARGFVYFQLAMLSALLIYF